MKDGKILQKKEKKGISPGWSDEEIVNLKHLIWDLLEGKNFEQAEPVAKQLTAICPDDAEAWFLQGSADEGIGELNKAKQSYYRSLELGGDEGPLFYKLSSVYMLQGNFVEAIQWCRRALKKDPNFPLLNHRLAELQNLAGNTREAIKTLEAFLKIVPRKSKEDYETRLQLGHLFMNINEMKRALIFFHKAIELNPSNLDILTNIGHCHSRLNEYEEAFEAFRVAAQLEPDPQNLYNLGDNYLARGNPQEAVFPLIKAVRKDPDYALAQYDLSLAFFDLKKYPEAASAAEAALRSDPEMRMQQINLGIGATSNLGLSLMNLGKYEGALECFERNLRLIGPTYFNKGLTLCRMKRFKEAWFIRHSCG